MVPQASGTAILRAADAAPALRATPLDSAPPALAVPARTLPPATVWGSVTVGRHVYIVEDSDGSVFVDWSKGRINAVFTAIGRSKIHLTSKIIKGGRCGACVYLGGPAPCGTASSITTPRGTFWLAGTWLNVDSSTNPHHIWGQIDGYPRSVGIDLHWS